MKHIDDFTIHRFRGMREAKLEALGQINLLVGGNNSGKTSVLEAISLFCDPLNRRNWSNVASARETGSLRSNLSISLNDRLLWLFPHDGLYPREDLFPHDKLFPQEDSAELSLSASGSFPPKNVMARHEKFSEVIKERIPGYAVGEDVGQRDDSSYVEREREVEGIRIEANVSLRNDANAGQRKSLDAFWEKFIPTYPRSGRLHDRLDMPSIFFSSTHSIAVYQGGGSELCKNLKGRIREHDPYVKDIHAFGLILDADKFNPQQKATKNAKELREIYPGLVDEPGKVVAGKPRTGIYVFPEVALLGEFLKDLLELPES